MRNFHSYLQQVATVMQGFMQQYLVPHGIEQCSHCLFDLKAGRISMISSDYPWNCVFWEKNLDLHFHHRIHPGLHRVNSQHDVYHHYQHYRQTVLKKQAPFFKYDWVQLIQDGYELWTFVSEQALLARLLPHLHWVQSQIAQAHAAMLARYPDMWVEMRSKLHQPPPPPLHEPLEPFLAQSLQRTGALLTSAEQRLLAQLVEHRYDGMLAMQRQCRRDEIQAEIRGIKQKLGNPSMSDYMMFALLFQPPRQPNPFVSVRLQ